MEQEIWKDVEGFSGYQISNLGRVKSYKRKNEFIRKTSIVGGYVQVALGSKNIKKQTFYIHRLIAKAFIPNHENKPEINHIDGNKLNNNISNLEWVTRKENCQHAWDNGLCISTLNKAINSDFKLLRNYNKKRSKPVYSSKLDMKFESINSASRYIQTHYFENNVNSIVISNAIGKLLSNKLTTSIYDYYWSYINK